jgi:NAD(P)-dependent dehydrogenase (short-subunit alcohol dehydrogenase family)
MPATSLVDRVTLITGGGSGIGAATARNLAEAGVGVAIMGRRDGPLAEVGASIRASGGRCLDILGDVRDYTQVEDAIHRTIAAMGRLDNLVANAALVDHGPDRRGGRRLLGRLDRDKHPRRDVCGSRVPPSDVRGWQG